MAAFQLFWDRYPRKVSRAAAERAWGKLCPPEHEQQGLFDWIDAGLTLWLEREWKGKDEQYVTHAATWLNQGRWRDAERPAPEGSA